MAKDKTTAYTSGQLIATSGTPRLGKTWLRNLTFAKTPNAARDAYRAGKLTPSSKASVKMKCK